MFSYSTSGSTKNTESWLARLMRTDVFASLSRFGEEGVASLRSATPIDDGETAAGWYYEIVQNGTSWSIIWGNSHVVDGTPVAILLQHGHGTGTGGYVQGRDFINPALRPIFDRMAAEAWKVVTSA